MAKVRMNGANYYIVGGKCRVNGTNYAIKKGRTLVGVTGYDINLYTRALFNVHITRAKTGPNQYCNIFVNGTLKRVLYAEEDGPASTQIEVRTGDTVRVYFNNMKLSSWTGDTFSDMTTTETTFQAIILESGGINLTTNV